MRVDLMGARHTIDMLGVLGEKTRGNLTPEEEKLMQSVLFELRMSFLEMTQAIAQSAQAKAGKPGAGIPGSPGGSPIVGGPLPGGKIKL
jgi:DNA replication initiation complex subunit (GINS family)